jgi:integrase
MQGGTIMARLPSGVRKRENGSFEKRFSIDGKQYSVTSKTLAGLNEKEEKKRQQVKMGAYTDNKNVTLGEYFDEWIDKKEAKNKAKGSSLHTYINHFNKHIRPYFGASKIQKIEKRQVVQFQTELIEKTKLSKSDGGISQNTCNQIFSLLKSVLNGAVTDEIILVNPAQRVSSIKLKGKKATETYHRALTKEEQKLFMDELKEMKNYYYDFIAFMLTTGMRQGEVSSLKWSDIDYKKNIIHVRSTVTTDRDGHSIYGDTTKTPAGERDIPLTENVKKILASQRSKNKIMNFNDDTVFKTSKGGKVSNNQIGNTIKRTLRSLEAEGKHIDHFTSHALRDTYATRCIEGKMDIKTLQVLMGHEDFNLTMSLYAHVMEDTKQEEMRKVNIVI